MIERRAQTRKRAFLLARISAPAHADHWCTVANISNGGAKLSFAERAPPLAERFELVIAATRQSYFAKVVWRSEREIGVSFEAEGYASPEPASPCP